MSKTKHMWIYQIMLMSFLFFFGACEKEESTSNEVEVDTQTPDGWVMPNMEPIEGNFPRAKLINRCINIWRNITHTKYVFNSEKVIDEENGIYKFDCSGFVGQIVIDNVLSSHYKDLENNVVPIIDTDGDYINTTRPLAGHFYDYFKDKILKEKRSAENDYWKVFMNIDSLERGDIIVARYDDNWRISNNNKTTGHIMIAWEINSVDSNNEIIIQVMDAAASAHTINADTRTCNEHPVSELLRGNNSGIGFGNMIFKISTNEHHSPHAFKWSTNSNYFYNLVLGDDITYQFESTRLKYDRLKGIVFARAK